MLTPFDPGIKPLDSYTANELLKGAEDQVQRQYEAYADKHPLEMLRDAPELAVAIDCGGELYDASDDGYLLVSLLPGNRFAYYFARSDTDFQALGGSDRRDVALLSLKACMGQLRSGRRELPEWMAVR